MYWRHRISYFAASVCHSNVNLGCFCRLRLRPSRSFFLGGQPQKYVSDVWHTVMNERWKWLEVLKCQALDRHLPWPSINKDRQVHESLQYRTSAPSLLFSAALTNSNNSCKTVINLHYIYKLLKQHSPFLLDAQPLHRGCGLQPRRESIKLKGHLSVIRHGAVC